MWFKRLKTTSEWFSVRVDLTERSVTHTVGVRKPQCRRPCYIIKQLIVTPVLLIENSCHIKDQMIVICPNVSYHFKQFIKLFPYALRLKIKNTMLILW